MDDSYVLEVQWTSVNPQYFGNLRHTVILHHDSSLWKELWKPEITSLWDGNGVAETFHIIYDWFYWLWIFGRCTCVIKCILLVWFEVKSQCIIWISSVSGWKKHQRLYLVPPTPSYHYNQKLPKTKTKISNNSNKTTQKTHIKKTPNLNPFQNITCEWKSFAKLRNKTQLYRNW